MQVASYVMNGKQPSHNSKHQDAPTPHVMIANSRLVITSWQFDDNCIDPRATRETKEGQRHRLKGVGPNLESVSEKWLTRSKRSSCRRMPCHLRYLANLSSNEGWWTAPHRSHSNPKGGSKSLTTPSINPKESPFIFRCPSSHEEFLDIL